VLLKKFELILRAATEIFARQLLLSVTADLPFLTILSFSSQLCWLCSASLNLATNSFFNVTQVYKIGDQQEPICAKRIGAGYSLLDEVFTEALQLTSP